MRNALVLLAREFFGSCYRWVSETRGSQATQTDLHDKKESRRGVTGDDDDDDDG
jgi:hypothetical protein